MFVASNLPHGLVVDHDGVKITLNGANVGFDPENLPKNGAAPDSAARHHGHGLTELTGKEADAFKSWFALSGKGPGPVQSGAIIMADTAAGARKEAVDNDAKPAVPGIDPAKDLPQGMETKKD